MNLVAKAISTLERAPLPDHLASIGINYLVSRTKRRLLNVPQAIEDEFVGDMQNHPIAIHTDLANAQHYEVPAAYFELVLGPRRKYSCCLYSGDDTTLGEAELLALAATVKHAGLRDGQKILELGCGWGSLSLNLAEKFPASRITAVSNSKSQRAHIEKAMAQQGLVNLEVVTTSMNDFSTDVDFDRIISVEMFEHMTNWRALLDNIRGWLAPDGRLFVHVFTHRNRSYHFDHTDSSDWIAKHFFTGGIMPAHDLPHRFQDLFAVEAEWRWSGLNYKRTADDWLANFDANEAHIMPILADAYGRDAELWRKRWRLFFQATAGLFGHSHGQEWGIGHYLLAPRGKPFDC